MSKKTVKKMIDPESEALSLLIEIVQLGKANRKYKRPLKRLRAVLRDAPQVRAAIARFDAELTAI